MTIANEISRIKDNISEAYTVAAEKGAEIPETKNSENLAGCINSISTGSSGGGDIVTAVNYSGAPIKAGQKVWLNKNVERSQAYKDIGYESYTWQQVVMNRHGTLATWSVSTTVYTYNIETDVKSSANPGVNWGYYAYRNSVYPFKFDALGNMFIYMYRITSTECQTLPYKCDSDGYAHEGSYLNSNFMIHKLNEQLNKVKTWSTTGLSSHGGQISTAVRNGYIYLSEAVNNYRHYYYAKLDEDADTLEFSSITSFTAMPNGLLFFDFTLDGKLLVAGNTNSGNPYYGVKLYTVNDSTHQFREFTTQNPDLAYWYGFKMYMVFNKQTGVLCVSSTEGSSNRNYGIFKYNSSTGDFDTLPITLENTQYSAAGPIITMDDQFRYIVFGNTLYTLEQHDDGKYRGIPYSSFMGSNTLTGVANEDAAMGAEFEATTILSDKE